jgi:hypothetical protein
LGARLRTAIVGVCFAALLFAAPSAHAAFPGQNGKIAYLCGFGICTINSDGTQNTRFTQIAPASDPAWSPDGTKIAFAGNSGNNAEIYVMQADGTTPTPLTLNQLDDEDPAWSPDGTKIVFTSNRDDPNPSGCAPSCNLNLYVMNADGSQQTRLTSGGFVESDPSWAPNGARIAFHCGGASGGIHNICLVNPDGTGLVNLGAGEHPNWLPDGSKIAFDSPGQNASGVVFTMNPDGTGRTMLTPDTTGLFLGEPAWSPDSTKFADAGRGCFTPSSCAPYRSVETRNADGTPLMGLTAQPEDDHQPDWQPIPYAGYPRPRGASPFLTYLVPAYRQCAGPTSTHGAPLSYPSCHPPGQASDFLTVGTPDSNGRPAGSVGSLRYTVTGGNTATPDLKIDVSITGVLNKTVLTPYSGELSADAGLRITDGNNIPNPGGPGPATVQDTSFPVTVPCSGSSCAVATSANAVMAGSVNEGNRAVWQLGQVRVYDGGSDGVASTTVDNTLFMDQGVFIP